MAEELTAEPFVPKHLQPVHTLLKHAKVISVYRWMRLLLINASAAALHAAPSSKEAGTEQGSACWPSARLIDRLVHYSESGVRPGSEFPTPPNEMANQLVAHS